MVGISREPQDRCLLRALPYMERATLECGESKTIAQPWLSPMNLVDISVSSIELEWYLV